jgi:hypothetical protein
MRTLPAARGAAGAEQWGAAVQCTETGTAEGEQRTKGEEAKQDRVLLEWAGNAVGTCSSCSAASALC